MTDQLPKRISAHRPDIDVAINADVVGYKTDDDAMPGETLYLRADTAVTKDERMSEWQDISTAPRDGTDILIWQPKEDEQFVVYWDDAEEGWRFSPRHILADDPTHWMPLPDPPQ